MQENDSPRETNVFIRGQFLDKGVSVQARTPRALHSLPEGAPQNRLGLAQWLASPNNPLVARVFVNRWWGIIFGHGIVATSEDFGRQGEQPTHPALLDWLAVELMENNWSMKHIHKTIVMSSTYRQDSRMAEAKLKSDPNNRWLSRGPRFRLPAEIIRDNALAISGLLSQEMGGPTSLPATTKWPVAANGSQRTGIHPRRRRTPSPPRHLCGLASRRSVSKLCEL